MPFSVIASDYRERGNLVFLFYVYLLVPEIRAYRFNSVGYFLPGIAPSRNFRLLLLHQRIYNDQTGKATKVSVSRPQLPNIVQST